jgi:hypothetical protein
MATSFDAYRAALAMGIPEPQARLAAAQARLETGGRAPPGNNYFGIKGSGTAGSLNLGTHEQGARGLYSTRSNFAAYNNPNESLNAWWGKLQRQWPEAAKAGDLKSAALGLHTGMPGGYATDRNYVNKILGVSGQNTELPVDTSPRSMAPQGFTPEAPQQQQPAQTIGSPLQLAGATPVDPIPQETLFGMNKDQFGGLQSGLGGLAKAFGGGQQQPQEQQQQIQHFGILGRPEVQLRQPKPFEYQGVQRRRRGLMG